MTFEEIEAIVGSLDGRGIDEVEITAGTTRLKLRFGAAPLAASTTTLAAPSPGRFRPMHPLETAPRFALGDAIHAGDIVAFVEANGILKPVIASANATLGAQLVDDGALVGWGPPLYAMR